MNLHTCILNCLSLKLLVQSAPDMQLIILVTFDLNELFISPVEFTYIFLLQTLRLCTVPGSIRRLAGRGRTTFRPKVAANQSGRWS